MDTIIDGNQSCILSYLSAISPRNQPINQSINQSVSQSIRFRTLHRRRLHPAPSPGAARLAPPTPAPVLIPRHSPTPSFTFFPHLADTRGKATGAVLRVLLAVAEVDTCRAAPRNTSYTASSNTRRVPASRKSAATSLLCLWPWEARVADDGGASAGAAAIPGPIARVVAIVEVARVATLGQLLGCGGATPSPPTPP
jgi:hypothetical protein